MFNFRPTNMCLTLLKSLGEAMFAKKNQSQTMSAIISYYYQKVALKPTSKPN
jgi:hypothetical protein